MAFIVFVDVEDYQVSPAGKLNLKLSIGDLGMHLANDVILNDTIDLTQSSDSMSDAIRAFAKTYAETMWGTVFGSTDRVRMIFEFKPLPIGHPVGRLTRLGPFGYPVSAR